ncbi:hypothetical protein FB565_000938 [Actinoplanes lutulentus]|uniref:Uncharacterized protein n=1 Tax=Actinoplanes lutulentus TaxID=1287878 RepID=A0A327ZLG0_9ACTN|nr:hypothetical protein [Actinoplanes lutulentus]MBB2941234.1 hypothetical protein [Actinoplanes lutulentus]RAK43543.1 hypothetical protein B0I29_101674 [Actinoplanes lutulentus]
MNNLTLALDSAWKVLLIGILIGAGLPAIFAFGIRSMAYGTGGDAEVHATGSAGPRPHPAGRIGAAACFGVVLLGVALGITFIVATGFGKELSFEHVYPTLVSKD